MSLEIVNINYKSVDEHEFMAKNIEAINSTFLCKTTIETNSSLQSMWLKISIILNTLTTVNTNCTKKFIFVDMTLLWSIPKG